MSSIESELNRDRFSEIHRTSRLLRFVRGFAIGAVIGTFSALFASHYWVADVLSHFAIQFAFLLLVGAVASLFRRHWASAILFSCCFLINGMPVVPYLFPVNSAIQYVDKGDGESYRLVSFNVLRTNDEIAETVEAVLAEDPDWIFLMEVYGDWRKPLAELKSVYPFQKVISRESYVGVAFLSKHPWREINVHELGEISNPSVEVTFDLENSDLPLKIVGTHPVPPFGASLTEARDKQLSDLADLFAPEDANLLVGDFNLSPWSPRFRRIGPLGILKDASIGYSFSPTLAPLPTLLGGLKVDHVLRNDNITTQDFRLVSNSGSDHHMLVYDFRLNSLMSDDEISR